MKLINCKCPMCGNDTLVIMTDEEYERYTNGESLISIFPNWIPNERELLITGMCLSCQDKYWPKDED